MKIKYKIIFLILLIIIAGVVCIFIFRAKIGAKLIPGIKEMDTVNVKIINDTAYVSSRFIAKNKSFLPLKIDSIKYEISLMNKVYLHEEKFLGINLKAYSRDTFDFSLKIPITSLVKDLKEERKRTDSANYSINIEIQYVTIFGRAELPINKASRLKIPKPPNLEIMNIDYEKVRLKDIKANVKVKVTNFNELELTINSINYKLSILNHGIVTGKYPEPIKIKAESESIINLPIEIQWEHIGKTFMDILRDKDKYDYILFLDAEIISPNPKQKPIILNLSNYGKMELKK